jgi:regulator of protease activity HflC (stomatin/prohibitin superfamily)
MMFLIALAIAAIAFFVARKLAAGTDDPMRAAALAGARRVLSIVAVVALVAAFAQLVRIIPAGHVGIVDLFGVVRTESLKSGIHLINPLASVVPMSIKTQELKEQMEVPSKEGLTMQLEVSALFHLDPEKAPEVYRTVGTSYSEILLEPQFRSVARGVTASYEAKALYTSEREHLAGLLADELRKLVEPRGIVIENTPLRRVGLPQGLAASIEQKLSAEQESQRMEFVLTKERQEAERKRIEAQGVADFQRIVSQGISDQLLKWKGIEATMEIARSQNSKVVVIGAGKDGLPLILGGN